MKVKNSYLPFAYLVIGLLSIIGVLAINIPSIQRYRSDVNVLSNAIKINIENKDEKLAEFNGYLLDSRENSLKSTISRTITFVTILIGWTFIRIAIFVYPPQRTPQIK